MKIGLFFGSFNPIHVGHMIVANSMLEYTDLDNVWFVVSPQNPFKKSSGLLHEQDRLDMVRLSIGYNFRMKASEIEFGLPRPSYTIDTLTYIQERYPKDEFGLIIGEDNLAQFPKWKNYEKILEYFSLYVYPRPDADETSLKNHRNVKMVEAPLLDISATFIRKAIRDGKSIQYLVMPEVETFIRQKKFYL